MTYNQIIKQLAKSKGIDLEKIKYDKEKIEQRKKQEIKKRIEESKKQAQKLKAKKQEKLKYSKLPDKYKNLKFSDLEQTKDNERAMTEIYEIAKNPDKTKKGIYLYGDIGVGKTTLMGILARYLIDYHQKNIWWGKEEALLNEIKQAYNNKTNLTDSDIIKNIATKDAIFIDELGQSQSDWSFTTLKRIIDAIEENNKLLFITTNYEYDQLKQRWQVSPVNKTPNQLLDRILGITNFLELYGKSYRSKLNYEK